MIRVLSVECQGRRIILDKATAVIGRSPGVRITVGVASIRSLVVLLILVILIVFNEFSFRNKSVECDGAILAYLLCRYSDVIPVTCIHYSTYSLR